MTQKQSFFTIFLISLVSYGLSNSTQASETPNSHLPPIVFNLSGFNSNKSDNWLQAHQTNSQQMSNTYHYNHTHTIKLEIPDFKFQLPSVVDPLKNSYHSFLDYKWYAAVGITSIAWFYLNFKLYTINQLLEDPNSWSLWKEEVPLNRLMIIDKTELLKQLKFDIYKKYFNVSNTAKEHELLIKFLENVTHEKNLLEFYQSICKLSYKPILVQAKTAEQIAQYISRLNFIMDLFLETYIQTNNSEK